MRYDPREIDVRITAGENRGRTLPHRNVVRELVSLGSWSGGAEGFALPASHDAALQSALLVQEGTGGRIIAAARQP
ncbi:DUF1223 domain-containing protein [Thioclava sp. BHET1]|nr:DUF1223 domain-containing protein [Thioclava sp. BHET1]